MRTQPKTYARIVAYGLNTLVSLTEVSRISIEQDGDAATEFERCIVIYYVDGAYHELASPFLRSREDAGKALHQLMERLSAAIRTNKSVELRES